MNNNIYITSLDSICFNKQISGFSIGASEELFCKYYPNFYGTIEKESDIPRVSKLIDKIFNLFPKKGIIKSNGIFPAIVQLDTKGVPVIIERNSLNPGENTTIKYPKTRYIYHDTLNIYDIVPIMVGKSLHNSDLGEYYRLYKLPYVCVYFITSNEKIENTKYYYFNTSEDMIDFLKYLFDKKYLDKESLFTFLKLSGKKVNENILNEVIIDIFKDFNEKE